LRHDGNSTASACLGAIILKTLVFFLSWVGLLVSAVFPVSLLDAMAAPTTVSSAQKLVLWHTQDGLQATFLKSLLSEFADKNPGVSLEIEDIVDLSAVLLKGSALGALPDVVLAPADIAGMHAPLKLSSVERAQRNPDVEAQHYEALTLGRSTFGEPVLSGNHLVFYYDVTLLPRAPTSWEELAVWKTAGLIKDPPKRRGALGGWPFNDPYFFLPFLLTLGGLDLQKAALSSEKATESLIAYAELASHGIAEPDCGYHCATAEFYRGRFAYTINGEWAFEDTRKELGPRFGMAPLPTLRGRKMISPRGVFALLYPNNGLTSGKAHTLRALARWLQSPGVQARWVSQARRFPVQRAASRTLATHPDLPFRALARILEESAPVTPSPRMLFLWPALRKGVNMFLSSGLAPTEATRVMEETARAAEFALARTTTGEPTLPGRAP